MQTRKERAKWIAMFVISLPLLLIAAYWVVALTLSAVSEKDRAVFLFPTGYVTEGRKFGVSLGDSAASARAAFEQDGWKFDEEREHECLARDYPQGTKILLFRDPGWRPLVMCVGVKLGRVESIQWMASPYLGIDL